MSISNFLCPVPYIVVAMVWSKIADKIIDVCVVYAVIASITGLDYVLRGRKSFRGVGERRADARIVDVPGGGRVV